MVMETFTSVGLGEGGQMITGSVPGKVTSCQVNYPILD